jgi:hypothetical protein
MGILRAVRPEQVPPATRPPLGFIVVSMHLPRCSIV